jgi:KEOPS complex subunit Pcc1
MIIDAEFEFALGTISSIIYESLFPELEEEYQRTRSTLRLEQDTLILNVEADDLVSMRAALNGWLRLVKISCEMTSMHKL